MVPGLSVHEVRAAELRRRQMLAAAERFRFIDAHGSAGEGRKSRRARTSYVAAVQRSDAWATCARCVGALRGVVPATGADCS